MYSLSPSIKKSWKIKESNKAIAFDADLKFSTVSNFVINLFNFSEYGYETANID